MNFTFELIVTISDDAIDDMVWLVKENGEEIDRAIDMVLLNYDDFEWYCRDYYRKELREEIERRLKNEK